MAKKDYAQKKPAKEFQEEVLQIARVTRVVSGGRRLRFRATVVVGNRKGKVGVGVGKAGEVIIAIQKAVDSAKKNLILVKMSGDTIPHSIKNKYKSARILLMPAGEGTGIIAGGAIRKVVELAGIKNILSKSFGTSNKISTARATIEALQELTNTITTKGDRNAKKEKSEEKDSSQAKPEVTSKKKTEVKTPSIKKEKVKIIKK